MNPKPLLRGIVLVWLLAGCAPLWAGEVSGTLGANTTWNDTSSDYVIDNFFGPLVVPAGITLNVQAGVTVRVKYSNKSAMEVRGILEARGANLYLRTSTSTAGGKTSLRVLGDGRLTLAECRVSGAHDGAFVEDSRLIEGASTARVQLLGNVIETGSSGTSVATGVYASGTSTVEFGASTAGVQNVLAGFSRALQHLSLTPATLARTAFARYDTALDFGGGSATVTNCFFTNGAASVAIRFLPDDKSLTIDRCQFFGGSRGVLFDAGGGDLTMRNTLFTNCTVGVEALNVRNLTFNDSSISASNRQVGTTGLHTEKMVAFAAANSAISRQEKGIYVLQENRGINVSGIAFVDNTFNVYSGGTYVLPPVITNNLVLLAGRYVISNGAGGVTIAAGGSLQISPGTVLVNLYPGQDLFRVNGRLVAEGARFELQNTGGGGRIVLAQDGAGVFSNCVFSATSAHVNAVCVLAALERSTCTVTSCRFETSNAGGAPYQCGIGSFGDSQVLVAGTSVNPSSFNGFPVALESQSSQDLLVRYALFQNNTVALKCLTDANLLLEGCTFSDNQTAVACSRVGAWWVNSVKVERNATGLDLGNHWTYSTLPRQGFQFTNNTYDVVLRTKGAAVDSDLEIGAGDYAVDCDGDLDNGSPLRIAPGATLTLSPGARLRTVDAAETTNLRYNTYNLFLVEGTLIAEGVTLDLRTMYHPSAPLNDTTAIAVAGDGTVTLRACTIRAGNRARNWDGGVSTAPKQDKVFHVSGRGKLWLGGCTVTSAESVAAGDACWRTGYGIVAENEGSVTLEAYAAKSTQFDGFLTANLSLRGQANATLAAALLSGASIGLDLAAGRPPQFGSVTIQSCDRGIHYGTNWVAASANTSSLVITNNTHARYLQTRGVSVASNLTLSAGAYTVDCDGDTDTGSPARVEQGATLTLLPGTVIRAIDSYEITNLRNDTYNLFHVEGSLVAEKVTLELRTISHRSYPTIQAACVAVAGDGSAQLRGCVVRAGNRTGQWDGNPAISAKQDCVFRVSGRGSLLLAGCTLATGESTAAGDAYLRVGHGVVLQEEGTLTLTPYVGSTNLIDGFSLAGLGIYGFGSLDLRAGIVRGCDRGLNYGTNWVGAASDTSKLVIRDCTHSRYLQTRGVSIESNLQLSAGAYTVDCDGDPYVGSPLKIAAGATLSLVPGTLFRTIDSAESVYLSQETFNLFQVEGTLVAQGASFDLRTLSHVTLPQGVAMGFAIEGDGIAQFSGCDLRVGNRVRQWEGNPASTRKQDRIFHVRGRGRLVLAGCSLTTGESDANGDAYWPTGFGVVTEDAGSLTLASYAGRTNLIEGFAQAGLSVIGSAPLDLREAVIQACVHGISYGSNWVGARSDSSRLVFTNNLHDRYLRTAGAVISADQVLSAGDYTVDCDEGSYLSSPVVIASGATLSLVPGTVLRTIDGYEPGNFWYQHSSYDLFRVEGTLVAQGARLELRTLSYQGYPPGTTRSIAVVGNGVIRMSGCAIHAGNRLRNWSAQPSTSGRQDRVFALSGRGSLQLAGCTLATTESEAAGDLYFPVGIGVSIEDEATLTLAEYSGKTNVISGFSSAGLSVGGSAGLNLTTAVLQGCARGIDYGTNWVGARSDSFKLVMIDNGYDRYLRTRGAQITTDLALSPGAYTVDCDGDPDTGSPARIAPGAKLSLLPGTVLETIDSQEDGNYWYRSPYNLFQVEGTLEAEGATLELRGMSYLFHPPSASRLFAVLGTGAVRMARCTIHAGNRERNWDTRFSTTAKQDRVFSVSGSGQLSLLGCTLTTGESEVSDDVYWPTGYAIAAEDHAVLSLGAFGAQPGVIEGFCNAGIMLLGNASLTCGNVQVRNCETGIHYGSTGSATFAGTRIFGCTYGFDQYSGLFSVDTSTVAFESNQVDHPVRGSYTVTTDAVLPPGVYDIENTTSPVLVAKGARLLVSAGAVIRCSIAPSGTSRQYFIVEGTLAGTNCEFQMETFSPINVPGMKGIWVRSNGVVELTASRLVGSETAGTRSSTLVAVDDAASLKLLGCDLVDTDQSGFRTYSGLACNGTGNLVIQDSTFYGFPVGLQTAKVPPSYSIRTNQFIANTDCAVTNLAAQDLDCTYNWWGHPSGPRHRSNPLAQGAAVSDRVLFQPYLSDTQLPFVLLAEHPAGQATNAFGSGGATANTPLFRFSLNDPAGGVVGGLTLDLVDVLGLNEGAWHNTRLVLDKDADGSFNPQVDQVLLSAAENWTNQTVSFAGEIPGTGHFLVIADLAAVPSGAMVKLRLAGSGVGVEPPAFVIGTIEDAAHFRDRVVLSDHQAGPLGDNLSAAETQTATLMAFHVGPGCQMVALKFDLSGVVGLELAGFRDLALVGDANGNGLAETNELRSTPGLVSLSGTTGSIRFDLGSAPMVSGGNYLLRGTLTGLRAGNAFTITLAAPGITCLNPGTVVSGSTRSVTHLVESPLFVLDAGFQVENQFMEADGLPRLAMLGFTFIPAGKTVSSLRFQLSDVSGIKAWEISNARIYRDENRNGVLDTRETVAVGGAGTVQVDENLRTGTISFSVPFTVQGTYLLAADFAHLDKDDSLTVELDSRDVRTVSGDLVDGGVSPVRHTVRRPGLPDSALQQNWALTWRSPGGLEVVGGYSRDGRKAVVGYGSGAAYVYDLATGVPERMMMRHYDAVQYAGFSADDTQIITVTRDGAVYIWSAATGELQRQLFADVLVRYAVPSPDFTRLLVVTEGRAFLLSLLEERQLWEFDVNSEFLSVDFSPDGKRVLLGCADKRAYVLDAQTGQIPRVYKNGNSYDLVFQGHHDAVNGVAFTAQGTRIMTASRDATATLWNAEDPVNPLRTITLNNQRCDFAWVSRQGDRIAMVTDTRYLRLFDAEGREIYYSDLPRTEYSGVFGFALFSDDGSEFMLGGNHSNNGAAVSRYRTSDNAFLAYLGPTGLISDDLDSPVRMSGDGRRVFFLKNNGLEVLQRRTGVPLRQYPEITSQFPYDITPDGAKLAWVAPTNTAGSALRLAIVDDDRLTVVASQKISQPVAPLSLAHSGGLAAVSDKIYRTDSGDLFADSPNTDGAYRNAFSPDNKLWGIAITQAGKYSIKTMRTTDASGSLEYGVTLTGTYQPMKVLYHPNGLLVGCVFTGGVQFYRLDNNLPSGLYDNRGNGLRDAVLSHDGTMLLTARDNSARLYDMRTGRVLRYFYPLHSGQSTCLVRSIAFGAHDDIVMVAWSDNYVETYERARLVGLEITPNTRTMAPGTTQEFRVEALYNDGSRQNVSPRTLRTGGQEVGARFYPDPALSVDIVENRVTLSAQALGTVNLTAVYSEAGVVRSAAAAITVGACPLVALTPTIPEITLSHGAVLPVGFIASYADGYQEEVMANLASDAPEHVRIVGNNVTVLRSAGTRQILITGTYTSRGITKTGTMRINTHGPESNWVRGQVTSGGDVFALDYRPDGTQLAVGGSSGAISLYRVGVSPNAYELQAVIPAHDRPVRGLYYMTNTVLLTVGEDGRIRTWNLADTLEPLSEYSHDAVITCAAYREGYLAFGDNLGRVQVLLLKENRIIWSKPVHEKKVRAVALDGDSVWSGGDDRRAVLSSRADGTRLKLYTGYSDAVVAVGIRNGMTYTVSEDKRLLEWTKGTVDENLVEYFLPGLPTAMRQTADRLFVTVGAPATTVVDQDPQVTGYGSTTWIYDNNGLLLQQLEHPPKEGRVTALAVSPGGDYLLTGRSTVVLKQVDKLTGEVTFKHFPFHSVQFWHASRSSYQGSLDHNRSIESARVSRDGAWLFTQSAERVFRWRLGASLGRSKFLETGYDIPFRFDDLRMSDDATGVIGTRVGETMYLLDGVQRVLRMSVHQEACSIFDVSPNAKRLISRGDNLRLWDIGVDFPTVLHEIKEKPADCLAFFPTSPAGREGDWLIGLSGKQPFLAIMNSSGLQFSGATLPLPQEYSEGRIKPTVAVARNQARCAVIAQPLASDGMGGLKALDRAIIYVYNIYSDGTGIQPLLLRQLEVDALGAKVALALSDDGTLLFYGGTPADDQGAALGNLLDLNTGRLLYSFAPPSMGSMANRGPAAAQFTQNDGALMIAWGEGYSSIHLRQGLQRLEITPLAKSVAPGEVVPLQATAVYVDGTRLDVTQSSEWSLLSAANARLERTNGTAVFVSGLASTGSVVRVQARFAGLGTTLSATNTLMVRKPQFLQLTVDPPRKVVAPGDEVLFRYFAKMADGSTREVTGATALVAAPPERVEILGTRAKVSSVALYGYIQIEGRCSLEGDERTVLAVLNVRNPAEIGNPGDFDGDGKVAYPDVLHLVGHYGETTSSPRWDARCDFNANSVVDFPDVLALVGLYGKTYSGNKSGSGTGGQLPSALSRQPGDLALDPTLVQLRVAGPARPVPVGDEFEVRIYARETSAAARGILGGLVDVAFAPELVGLAGSFEASQAIAAPFNGLMTHGSESDARIVDLGGACLLPGAGDGADVLFATLRFVARSAGSATFSLSAGSAGMALAFPVGLVSSARVNYGAACSVVIVETPSIAQKAGFAGELVVSGGQQRQVLRFGAKPTGTASFDLQEGDAAGLPPGPWEEGAWLVRGQYGLASDVQPPLPRQVWEVQLNVPPRATGEQAWNLSWAAAVPPPGTGLLLVPADARGNPAPGLRRSLSRAGSLTIANEGSETLPVRFLIVWDKTLTQKWTLKPGWNRTVCTLEPGDEPIPAALADSAGAMVMRWQADSGYRRVETLEGGTCYLVYAAAPHEISIRGLPWQPGTTNLKAGWNLVTRAVADQLAASGRAFEVGDPSPHASDAEYPAAGPEVGLWIFLEQPATLSLGEEMAE